MDAQEIIKHVPDIATVAGPIAAAIPFTAIVKRMLGPAADEVAEMWRDQVRLYRYERQLKCVQKAERMAQEAGFVPHVVPPKILFPLLEGASWEENEDLHTMWAALLASAATPGNDEVRPGFIAILKQMAPDEAGLLNWLHAHCERLGFRFEVYSLFEADNQLGWQEAESLGRQLSRRLSIALDSLEAVRLIRREYFDPQEQLAPVMHGNPIPFRFAITALGLSFIESCRPPKSNS